MVAKIKHKTTPVEFPGQLFNSDFPVSTIPLTFIPSTKPMKKNTFIRIGIFASILSFPFQGISSDKKDSEIRISSKTEEVTVFLSSAQVKSKAEKTIEPGASTLIVENLSQNIDPNSLQVEGQGAFTILSVSHRMNYLKDSKKPQNITEMEETMESLRIKLELNQGLLNIYEQEKTLIDANKNIKGQNANLTSEDIEDVADFFRQRMADIMLKKIELAKIQKELNEQISKLQSQLNEFNAKNNRPTSEIVVEVTAEARVNAKLNISYVVYNAGWSPGYDLRAKDIQSPVNLTYKANVYQNTGMDWENVKLNLSTGNPTLSGTKPQMQPWILNFQNRVFSPGTSYQAKPSAMAQMEGAPMSNRAFELKAEEEDAYVPPATTGADFTQLTESQLNMEFNIKIPYTIPDDGKPHTVQIQNISLPASYEYYAAPKLDKEAFLLARISGWNTYNLLSGEANVFYEGTFTGKSYINTQITKDTLDISLGRDKNIVITRNRIKDFTEKKIIGSSKKETLGIEVALKNKKNIPVEIVIQDQVPVSANKDIEVEILELSGARKNDENGFLEWKTKLEPSGMQKYIIKYSVKYPKDKIINL